VRRVFGVVLGNFGFSAVFCWVIYKVFGCAVDCSCYEGLFWVFVGGLGFFGLVLVGVRGVYMLH